MPYLDNAEFRTVSVADIAEFPTALLNAPGRFSFQCEYPQGHHHQAKGDIAVLWAKSLHNSPPSRVDVEPTALDVSLDTYGKLCHVLPGLSYRVTVSSRKSGFLWRHEQLIIQSEVIIEENHAKTKIWLLKGAAKDILGDHPMGLRQMSTVYRFGCWCNRHFNRLFRTCKSSRSIW